MTFLPLAHLLLAAVSPLLAPIDSGTVTRTTPTPAVVDTTTAIANPISTITSVVDAGDAALLAAAAPSAAPAAAPAAPAAAAAMRLAAGGWALGPGMVPMPSWVSGTHTGLLHAGHADSIVVEKGEHRMTLYSAGERLGTYQVALGKQTGKKERIGDYKTPEGLYHIDAKNPSSHYHLALHVSYPNADDLARARQLGAATGGDIMIHGLPNGQGSAGITHRNYDWTNGCVAVTDQEIEEIFGAVAVGTPVRIKP